MTEDALFQIIWPRIALGLLLSAGKNWLFSDTTKDAEASAVVYSIIETAKANNLNVSKYLNYLLLYMPDANYRIYPE